MRLVCALAGCVRRCAVQRADEKPPSPPAPRPRRAARSYVRERSQFGAPLGSFQLVQERLARMLGNIQVRTTLRMQLAGR